MPAIFIAYNGQAYKHLRASSLSEDSFLRVCPETSLDYLFPYGFASTNGWHRALSYGALRIA